MKTATITGVSRKRVWAMRVVGLLALLAVVVVILGLGESTVIGFSGSRFAMRWQVWWTVFAIPIPGTGRTREMSGAIASKMGVMGPGQDDWVMIGRWSTGVRGGKLDAMRILHTGFFYEQQEERWLAYLDREPVRARAVLLRVGESLEKSLRKGMFAAHAGVVEAIKDDPEAIACYGEEAFEVSRQWAEVWEEMAVENQTK